MCLKYRTELRYKEFSYRISEVFCGQNSEVMIPRFLNLNIVLRLQCGQ